MNYSGKKSLLGELRNRSELISQNIHTKNEDISHDEEIDVEPAEAQEESFENNNRDQETVFEKPETNENETIEQAQEVEEKKGFDHGQKGPRERMIDRETFIAILRACGYPIPMTKEEWKEYLKKSADFLKRLAQNQSHDIIVSAKRTARIVVKVAEEDKDIDRDNIREKAHIPLKDKKINVFEDFENLSDEQKAFVLQSVVVGIENQGKALIRAVKEKREDEQNTSDTGMDKDI